MTRKRRSGRHRTLYQEPVASSIERLRASGYDFVFLTLIGAVLMTAFAWISGRDPLDDGGALAWCVAGLVLLSALYEVPSTALTGQTIGKHMVGIRVIALDGSRPGCWRALRRWAFSLPFGLLPEASLAAPVIVGASVAADPSRRGFHDHFAGTIVVRAPDVTAPSDRLKPRKRR